MARIAASVCGGHVLHALSAAGGAGTCPVADYSVFFVFFSHAEGTIACTGQTLWRLPVSRERARGTCYAGPAVLARESRSRRACGPDAWR